MPVKPVCAGRKWCSTEGKDDGSNKMIRTCWIKSGFLSLKSGFLSDFERIWVRRWLFFIIERLSSYPDRLCGCPVVKFNPWFNPWIVLIELRGTQFNRRINLPRALVQLHWSWVSANRLSNDRWWLQFYDGLEGGGPMKRWKSTTWRAIVTLAISANPLKVVKCFTKLNRSMWFVAA